MAEDGATIKDMINADLGVVAQICLTDEVNKLADEIIQSQNFGPALNEPVKETDLIIGEMTSRQKALLTIFSNDQMDTSIRERAYEMIQEDIAQDSRFIEKKDSGKTGLGMCEGYLIVLY